MSGSAPSTRSNHRKQYHSAWSRLTSPLRPHNDVTAAMRREAGHLRGRALLLGVTPELAGLGEQLIAVDRNHSMVSNIWPGNSASRYAIVADWQSMPFPAETFSVCIGDGSLTALRAPDQHAQLFAELVRVLQPGAKIICRIFAMPDPGETIAAVREAALAGGIRNFHAFKWRLAMTLASDMPDANVPAQTVYRAFTQMFGDRDELIRITQWNRGHVDTIDFYEHSISAFSFASQRQLTDAASKFFTGVRFVSSGTYELAERCPLMVMERR